MKTKFIIPILGCSLFLVMMAACVKAPTNNIEPEPTEPKLEDYFDFKIDQDVALSVDYCFTSGDYPVITEVYGEFPLVEDSNGELIKKADIKPLYRGVTDGKGKLSTSFRTLTAVSEVWVYSDYIGTLSPVKVEVKNKRIDFNQNDFVANIANSKTKASTTGGYKYPDKWDILSGWNQYGTPENLEAERKLPSAILMNSVYKIFVEYNKTPMQERYPDFFAPGRESYLNIAKPTKVYMAFLNSTASVRNTVGYYTFKTGEEPKSIDEVKFIMAIPSVTKLVDFDKNGNLIRGALGAGDRVQLKFWDGTKYVDEFPAGVSIGFWLEFASLRTDGNMDELNDHRDTRFSTDGFNSGTKIRRSIAMLDPSTKKLAILAFEDNVDMRYNDATFYIETDEGAIDGGNLPEMPEVKPPTSSNIVEDWGTLMFEDLWPSSGDYDMNDVMVKYKTFFHKNVIDNTITKIVAEFTPYHSGGSLQSAFGFQLTDLLAANIRSVKIEGATPSKFMNGQMMEPGQNFPTFILFDDIRNVVGTTITVTMEMNNTKETHIYAPFNPFIITRANEVVAGAPRREVHLVGQKPTQLADNLMFGTGNDGTVKEKGPFYVMSTINKQFPFALNMSKVEEMPVPREGDPIEVTYPEFRGWVDSKGTTNKSWYKNPKK